MKNIKKLKMRETSSFGVVCDAEFKNDNGFLVKIHFDPVLGTSHAMF